MGAKRDKNTSEGELSAISFTEKIHQIGGISSKKMFESYRLFHDGKMLGLVNSAGDTFLKTDDSLRSKFENSGAQFHRIRPYFSIPDQILNYVDQLVVWTRESIDISK